METIELFSGTKSFSKVAKSLGHKTFTIDIDFKLSPDFCIDLLDVHFIRKEYGVLWASPPCTAFSVASIGKHWNKGYVPKSNTAVLGLRLLDKTIKTISELKPKCWFIENPRGMMRKVIDDIFKKHGITDYRRITISYCQYGDTRQKPTDIWTNNKTWIPRLMCKNGDKCHISAPRGSRTGTQGLKNATERGVIPEKLFIELFKSIE